MENPNGDYGRDVSRGLFAPFHGHVYWSAIQKWQ
jgi:hypothetical protein